jgi:outer membrane scaffolding protein for murein synthesis (MipA/OmpV family)
MNRIRFISGLLVAASLPMPAHAQTPSPLPEWTYSAGVLLRSSLSPSIPEWSVLGGISAEYGPRYDGARQYHTQGGPTLEIRYRDLAYFSTGEGLGVNLLRGKDYRAGVSMVYDLGRRAQDSSDTQGLGNVNLAPELKAYGEYLIMPVMLRADVRHALGGYDGWIADLSVYMPVYGKREFFVFLGPSVTLADDHYMAHYFGVTPAQSAASGYTPYTAHAGLKSANMGGSATWLVTDHWLVNVLAGGQRLLGGAADSPLTLERLQYATALTLAYKF